MTFVDFWPKKKNNYLQFVGSCSFFFWPKIYKRDCHFFNNFQNKLPVFMTHYSVKNLL